MVAGKTKNAVLVSAVAFALSACVMNIKDDKNAKAGVATPPAECVFPDSPKDAAPLWVCDAPVEGVAGSAGVLTDPLPGTERLIHQLARLGLPAVPCGISEAQGRFLIRFGPALEPQQLTAAPDAARLVMDRIARLI